MRVKPTPIPLTKINIDAKSDKNCVDIKLRRGLKEEMSDLYGFKMALFYNSELEDFLLFVRKFQMTLEAFRTLTAGAKNQRICMLVRGEALHQLDGFSVEVWSTTTEHLNLIILGYVRTLFLLMLCQSKIA